MNPVAEARTSDAFFETLIVTGATLSGDAEAAAERERHALDALPDFLKEAMLKAWSDVRDATDEALRRSMTEADEESAS